VIRHLLIDLDGVIRRWKNRRSIEGPLTSEAIAAVAFRAEFVQKAITGVWSDETWRAAVVAELAGRYPSAEASVAAWSCYIGEVDSAVMAVIEESLFVENLTLITNATSRLNDDLRALGISDRFRHVVNASEVGFAKPDARIFQQVLGLLGAAASEVAFVDDQAVNIAAAEALGIRSHRFESPSRLRAFLGHLR